MKRLQLDENCCLNLSSAQRKYRDVEEEVKESASQRLGKVKASSKKGYFKQ